MARRMTPLARAAATEDRLAPLRELRTRVIESLDSAECVRDVEPLSRRLQSIAAEIDDLAALQPSNSAADVILARRAGRRAKGQVVSTDHSAEPGTKLHG